MKNKTIKKIIAVALVGTIAASGSVIAFAESIGSNASNPSIGIDEEQNAKTQYQQTNITSNVGADVYLTNSNEEFLVSVPKKVVLSGQYDEQDKKYKGSYTVGVDGDFAGSSIVTIKPDETTKLHQKGKLDKDATISQEKITFTYDDIVKKTNTTNGTVSAEYLTAGSWNSNFNFNVSVSEKAVYYSSIEKAVEDANNLNYENADIKPSEIDRAVASLTITKDNETVIRLLNDEENVPSFELNNKAIINLDGHTLKFLDKTKGIVANNGITIYDGTLEAINSATLLLNKNGNADINDVTFNTTVDNNATGWISQLDLYGDNGIINKCNFNITGEGNNKINVCSVDLRNSTNIMSGCNTSLVINTLNASNLVQCTGNKDIDMSNYTFTKNNISAKLNNISDKLPTINGICKPSIDGSNVTINIHSGNIKIADTYAIDTIHEGEYDAQDTWSCAIRIYSNGTYKNIIKNNCKGILNIDEKDGSVIFEGANSSVQLIGQVDCNINGGTYKSPNHGGMYCGATKGSNIKISNATFLNNYDEWKEEYQYSSRSNMRPFGAAYFGSHNGEPLDDGDIIIENSKFINNNKTFHCVDDGKNWFYQGITLKCNSGYLPPKNLILENCIVYGRAWGIRIDNGGKVTLRGSTKVGYDDSVIGEKGLYRLQGGQVIDERTIK